MNCIDNKKILSNFVKAIFIFNVFDQCDAIAKHLKNTEYP